MLFKTKKNDLLCRQTNERKQWFRSLTIFLHSKNAIFNNNFHIGLLCQSWKNIQRVWQPFLTGTALEMAL